MHWINFPLLTIMIWSGLRIYWADLRDPYVFGIFGWEIYEFFPDNVNETLGLQRRLARGMAFHFTFAWLFTINGAMFGLYLWRTGGWRNFVPTLDDLKTIPAVLLHEVGLRKQAPPQGKYNGVQQLSYGAILFMGFLVILSGFAIYKPTQLAPLTTLMGGYGGARFIHFATTIGFLLFFVVHILQVARAGLSGLFSMITGYELLPPEGPAPRSGYAEPRFNARIRDLITIFFVPLMISLLWAAIDSGPNDNWFKAAVFGAVAFGPVWDTLWVAVRGATPGKSFAGLRVVRKGTNETPSLLRAYARSSRWFPLMLLFSDNSPTVRVGVVFVVVMGIASIMSIITDGRRRSLVDYIAGTEVVTVESLERADSPMNATTPQEVAR